MKIFRGIINKFITSHENRIVRLSVLIFLMHKIYVDTQKDMNKLSTWNSFILIVMWCVMCNVECKLISDFYQKVNLVIVKYKIMKNIIEVVLLKIINKV